MSEFKGTIGNWEIVREGLQKYINSENRYIAEVWFGNEEHNSNAKLISCAPEMLEMLNKILEKDFDFDYYTQIENLINKATK